MHPNAHLHTSPAFQGLGTHTLPLAITRRSTYEAIEKSVCVCVCEREKEQNTRHERQPSTQPARGTSSEGLWVSLLPPGLEQNEALCLRLHRLGLENRDRRLVLEQLFGVVCSRGDFDRLLEVPTGVDIT